MSTELALDPVSFALGMAFMFGWLLAGIWLYVAFWLVRRDASKRTPGRALDRRRRD